MRIISTGRHNGALTAVSRSRPSSLILHTSYTKLQHRPSGSFIILHSYVTILSTFEICNTTYTYNLTITEHSGYLILFHLFTLLDTSAFLPARHRQHQVRGWLDLLPRESQYKAKAWRQGVFTVRAGFMGRRFRFFHGTFLPTLGFVGMRRIRGVWREWA
jgi:hypothetical protein